MRAEVPFIGEWRVTDELEPGQPLPRLAKLWEHVPEALYQATYQEVFGLAHKFLEGTVSREAAGRLTRLRFLTEPLGNFTIIPSGTLWEWRDNVVKPVISGGSDRVNMAGDVLSIAATIAVWDPKTLPYLNPSQIDHLRRVSPSVAGRGTDWWCIYLLGGADCAKRYLAQEEGSTGGPDDWTIQPGKLDDPASLEYLALHTCLYPERLVLTDAWWDCVLSKLQSGDREIILGGSRSTLELHLAHLSILAAGGIERDQTGQWRLKTATHPTNVHGMPPPVRSMVPR